jgi:hypothetical protein
MYKPGFSQNLTLNKLRNNILKLRITTHRTLPDDFSGDIRWTNIS